MQAIICYLITRHTDNIHTLSTICSSSYIKMATNFATQATANILSHMGTLYCEATKRTLGSFDVLDPKVSTVLKARNNKSVSKKCVRDQKFRFAKVQTSITKTKPLKRHIGPTKFFYAFNKVKGSKIVGSSTAARMREKMLEFETLTEDEQAAWSRERDASKTRRVLDVLGHDIVANSRPTDSSNASSTLTATPFNVGCAAWPISRETFATEFRLLCQQCGPEENAPQRVQRPSFIMNPVASRFAADLESPIDMKTVQDSPTFITTLETYSVHREELSRKACWLQHYGFCRTGDVAIASRVQRIVAMLNLQTKSVQVEDEGKPLLLLRSLDAQYGIMVAQGRPSRRPEFQDYIAHLPESAQLLEGERQQRLPIFQLSSLSFPCRVGLFEFSEAACRGKLPYISNYQLAVAASALADHWLCSILVHVPIDCEIVEATSETRTLCTSNLKGSLAATGDMDLGGVAGDDDLSNALAMFKAAKAAAEREAPQQAKSVAKSLSKAACKDDSTKDSKSKTSAVEKMTQKAFELLCAYEKPDLDTDSDNADANDAWWEMPAAKSKGIVMGSHGATSSVFVN